MKWQNLPLVFVSLGALSACQHKSPVGVWEMGPVTDATSDLETQFPAAAWAASFQPGAQIFLQEGGALYSAGAPIEEARLDERWSSGDIRFSFAGRDAHNVPSRYLFQGRYDEASDRIVGEFSQTVRFGEMEAALRGKTSFTRSLAP